MYRRDNQSVIVVFALLLTLTLGALGSVNKAVKAQSQSEPQSNVVWTVEKESPQPDDKTRAGRLRTDIISPNAPLVTPVTRAWTAAGSTGTVDEDSLSIAQVRNFTVSLQPGATGTVRVRYNITAVDGLNSFCPASASTIKIRYRDSDGVGTTAQVKLDFRFTNILSGGNALLTSFDSNVLPGAGSAFVTVTGGFGGDFDFLQNVYWIDATITRSNSSQFADLGSMQIWESAGTPCP